MSAQRVLVIIINWRQASLTEACVRWTASLLPADAEILLVDNGSNDGSVECLASAFPDLPLVALPENTGFAGAANVGLRRATEEGFDYALLLNNDAFPATDMLQHLLAETADDIALLSPKILYDDARDHLWFAGGRQHRFLLEMRETGQGKLDGPEWSVSRDVDYLLGTGLLVNLTAASEVGWLDERYFMYYEDLDWSIRLRAAGYRLRYVGNANLYHRVSISSGGVDSPNQRYHLARSSVLFFRRYARLGLPLAIFLFRLGSAIRAVLRLTSRGQWEIARSYLRGLYAGLRTGNESVELKADEIV